MIFQIVTTIYLRHDRRTKFCIEVADVNKA